MNRVEELKIMSYDVIRREIHRFDNEKSNDENIGFVRGVLELETEMFKKIESEVRCVRGDE